VLSAQEKYKIGACMLEQILKLESGIKMSHNKIHRVLREHELAKRDTKKARRRKCGKVLWDCSPETIDELVQWHNEIKPHISLNMDELETPPKAFFRKLPHERIIYYSQNC